MAVEQANVNQSYSKFSSTKQQKSSGGLFSHLTGAKKPTEASAPIVGADMGGQLRDFSRRLRLLEERFSSQRKNLHVMEHNMLTEHKKLQQQIRTIQDDFERLRKDIYEVKQQFDLIGAALRDTAKREDVKVLEKYINLWEPLQFVTRNEVERLIHFIVDSKTKK